MITPDEMRAIGREIDVEPTTIERDYVQNWFLKSLYENSDFLIFKGGTCIRKAHIQNYRFSDDLDFTLSREVKQNEIIELISKAKEYVHEEIGRTFDEEIQIKDVKSGWKVRFHYTSKITDRSIKLIVDLTHSNLEKVMTEAEAHPIFHNYSDECEVDLITYSLIEVTAEKLRALSQRGWPRDLYDVFNLWPRLTTEGIKEIFIEKCKFKGFEPSLEVYDKNEERMRSAWSSSMEHQLKNLPDFDEIYKGVRTILADELNLQ